MVLIVNNQILSLQDIQSLSHLYEKFPKLLEDAEKLVATKPKYVTPEGVLYVRQKEFVVTHHGDRFEDGSRISHVGTDDVLTCHVLLLHHPFTRVSALAHFDEYVTEQTLEQFLKAFLKRVRERYFDCEEESEDEWEWEEVDEDDESGDDSDEEEFAFEHPVFLHMVGGYADEAGKAQRLTSRILNFFHSIGEGETELENDQVFHLRTCCLGQPNSRMGNYFCHKEPIIGGVVVHVASGLPLPASFNRKFVSEVDEDLRMTLMLGPSLIRKPAKLKKIIKEKEDQGFGSKGTSRTLV